MKLFRSVIILLSLGCATSILSAQTQHFQFTSNTGNNATVGIPLTANPNISGSPLQLGDEIGVFTSEGLCVGGVVWNQLTTTLTVWGDNDQTTEVDGIQPGDTIRYRIWRRSTNTEYGTVLVTYSSGNGVYAGDGTYIVSSLDAVAPPDQPLLSTPADAATDQPTALTLGWNATARAEWYLVQLATDPSLNASVLSDSTQGTTFEVGSLSNATTYYWRVRASNAGGAGDWSTTRSFTTIPVPPDIPALATPVDGSTLQPISTTLNWNSTSGASSYAYQLSTVEEFATVFLEDTIASTSANVATLEYGTTYYWRVRSLNAGGASGWSSPWSFMTIGPPVRHKLLLPPGWSMISTFVRPTTTNLDELTADIRGNLVIMKNGSGEVFWPEIQANTIGSWDHGDGYQIYMSAADTLDIQGNEVIPETEPRGLAQGWHIISYMRNTELEVDSALSSLRANIIIVKNNQGNVYWPALDSFNNIGPMKPGQGYQIKLSASSNLQYPANTATSPSTVMTKRVSAFRYEHPTPRHFSYVQNTGVNATVGIPASVATHDGEGLLEIGDEIAAFSSDGTCVGATVWTGTSAVITVWGDDPNTPSLDGARTGDVLEYRVWRSALDREWALPVTLAEGNGPFEPDKIILISKIGEQKQGVEEQALPVEFNLSQNYPNPFNPTTTIHYTLPKAAHVEIRVFDLLGHEVAVLVNEQKPAGRHRLESDLSNLPTGIYFYRLIAGEFTELRKMVLVR